MTDTQDDLTKVVSGLKAIMERRKYHAIEFYEPYPKQQQFFEMGAFKRERLFVAGNQVGKTYSGAAETSYHLTGRYPTWWKGKVFTHPTRGWAVGVSWGSLRDVIQSKLLYKDRTTMEEGTGAIPKEYLIGKSMLSRPAGTIDTIQVRHASGGISTLKFLSAEMDREKLQGEPIDFAWCDEEPAMDKYTEIFARTIATRGIVYTTFTPLNGRTELYDSFLDEGGTKGMIVMTAYDAAHLSAEVIAENMSAFPEYEWEARLNGIPISGGGRVFQFSRESIVEASNEFVPLHWTKMWGIDFGIGHPFAAVLTAWDRDLDIVHVLATHRVKDQTPREHVVAIKQYGLEVPVSWPQDGTARDKGSGLTIASQYRKLGIKMLATPAMWPDGGNSTEAGVFEMEDRMKTGRLKVAGHLADWFEEFVSYSRDPKTSEIIKKRDDIMSATRIAIMGKRFGKPVPLGSHLNRQAGLQGWSGRGGPKLNQARGTNFDIWDPTKDED